MKVWDYPDAKIQISEDNKTATVNGKAVDVSEGKGDFHEVCYWVYLSLNKHNVSLETQRRFCIPYEDMDKQNIDMEKPIIKRKAVKKEQKPNKSKIGFDF